MTNNEHLDPVLILLLVGLLLFTGILIWVEYRFQSDGQMFQVIASLVAGFSGAFFGRIMPTDSKKPVPPASGVVTTPNPPIQPEEPK